MKETEKEEIKKQFNQSVEQCLGESGAVPYGYKRGLDDAVEMLDLVLKGI